MLSSMHGIFEIKVWGLQLEIYVANHTGKKQSQHSTIAIIFCKVNKHYSFYIVGFITVINRRVYRL